MWKELFRKSIHICSAFIPLLLWWNSPVTLILIFLALSGYTVCELLRLSGHKIPVVSKITEIAARKRDENRFVLGPVTLCTGIILAGLFFPHHNATIGIFALAFGDGLASVGGTLFGKTHLPFTKGKTLEGSLTCWTAVFIALWIYTDNITCALILATATMLIEMLPLYDFDNILIPLATGALSFLFV